SIDPVVVQNVSAGIVSPITSAPYTVMLNFTKSVTAGDIVLVSIDYFTDSDTALPQMPFVTVVENLNNLTLLNYQVAQPQTGALYWTVMQSIYGGTLYGSGNGNITITIPAVATYLYSIQTTAEEITAGTLSGETSYFNQTSVSWNGGYTMHGATSSVLGSLVFGSFLYVGQQSIYHVTQGASTTIIRNYTETSSSTGISFDFPVVPNTSYNPAVTLSVASNLGFDWVGAGYVAIKGTGLVATKITLLHDSLTTPINSTNFFKINYWHNHVLTTGIVNSDNPTIFSVDYGSQISISGFSNMSNLNTGVVWCTQEPIFYNNAPSCLNVLLYTIIGGTNGILVRNFSYYYYQLNFVDLATANGIVATGLSGPIPCCTRYTYQAAPLLAGSSDSPVSKTIDQQGTYGVFILANSILYPTDSFLGTSTQQYSAVPLTSGLIGYYPLDEGSGNKAYDLSGNAYTGTLVNSPTWLSGSACRFGTCLNFSNTANTEVTTALPFANSSSGTMSAWVYPTAVNDYTVVFGWKSASGYVLLDQGVGDWRAVFNPTGAGESAVTGPAVKLNSYVFLAMSWKLSNSIYNITLYVNGASQGSITQAQGTNGALGGFSIGEVDISNWISAIIDDVRVYNTALSASEINEIYQSASPVLEYLVLGASSYATFNNQATTTQVIQGCRPGMTLAFCPDAKILTASGGVYQAYTTYYLQYQENVSGSNLSGAPTLLYSNLADGYSYNITSVSSPIWVDAGSFLRSFYQGNYFSTTANSAGSVVLTNVRSVSTSTVTTVQYISQNSNPMALQYWEFPLLIMFTFAGIVAVPSLKNDGANEGFLDLLFVGLLYGGLMDWIIGLVTIWIVVLLMLPVALLAWRG
ncbi:MAG: LamG domain-containing protein, partial [Nitrososphaerota archaeon]|nr:LamG domain-containing protein [Nitrososphaerota archaeon]